MSNLFTVKRVIVGFVTLIVLIVVVSVSVGGGHKTTTATVTPPTSSAPAKVAGKTPPATPAMTDPQKQAVTAAQGYLTDGEGFSREGLLKQLTSSFGDGFSAADATFAVNYVNPDWDAQAVESAQGYLNDGEGFSKSSLTQQLTSDYGSGFTQAQAEYAVNKTIG